MELKPIKEAQTEAEKFFEREDVQAIGNEAFTLACVSLPNYQLSRQKREELHELERDLYHVACALKRRVKSFTFKP